MYSMRLTPSHIQTDLCNISCLSRVRYSVVYSERIYYSYWAVIYNLSQQWPLPSPAQSRSHLIFCRIRRVVQSVAVTLLQRQTSLHKSPRTLQSQLRRMPLSSIHTITFFHNCNYFFNSFIYAQQFSQRFFRKNVVKIFLLCKGLVVRVVH